MNVLEQHYCPFCMAPLVESDLECPFCGKKLTINCPPHHLLSGTVLHEKYLVGVALGEGGFGITYIGRDLTLDMKVAIKEYYPISVANRNCTVSLLVNPSSTVEKSELFEKGRERFLQEARILARFTQEPGIVGVRDYFEENGTAYIVMDYLEGETLQAHLQRKEKISADETMELMRPLMHSLDKVHRQGLIHRDISPDNIIISNRQVKLLDFGAARKASVGLDQSMTVILRPGYAPEEQYRVKGVQGPWTDVYALCAVIYRCVTGKIPDDANQRLYCDEVKTPSALGVKMPEAMETALMKGMAVLQEDRFQSVQELLDGLAGIGIGNGSEGKTIVPDTVLPRPEPQLPDPEPVPAPTPSPNPKKSYLWVGLAVCAAVILAVGIAVLSTSNRNDPAVDKPEQSQEIQQSEAPQQSEGDRSESQSLEVTKYLLYNDDSEPVTVQEPETSLDPQEIYSNLTYTTEMFYGRYQLLDTDGYLENMDYIEYKEYDAIYEKNRTRYITAIPYELEAGKAASFPDTIKALPDFQDHYWMRAYFQTKDGDKVALYCMYSIEENKLRLIPMTDESYSDGKRTYKPNEMNDYTLEYEFTFRGLSLTLSHAEESVTLYAGESKTNPVLHTEADLSSGSPGIDSINEIYLTYNSKSTNNAQEFSVYFAGPDQNGYESDRTTRRNNAGILFEDGLFTFTVPYNEGDKTYQFVYFYCGSNGLILTDGEAVYYYIGDSAYIGDSLSELHDSISGLYDFLSDLPTLRPMHPDQEW